MFEKKDNELNNNRLIRFQVGFKLGFKVFGFVSLLLGWGAKMQGYKVCAGFQTYFQDLCLLYQFDIQLFVYAKYMVAKIHKFLTESDGTGDTLQMYGQ